MLLIYGSLRLGGIETFFIRLAKERKKRGQTTKILLFEKKTRSDANLLKKMQLYSEVYFADDVFIMGKLFSKIPLIAPLNKKKVKLLLQDISHIHVSCGLHALTAYKLITFAKQSIPISVGFYHSLEFAWGETDKLPYFEKINRDFVLNTLDKRCLFTFSESVIKLYAEKFKLDISNAQSFRLGVVERLSGSTIIKTYNVSKTSLEICSIGRLVDFKSYNLWMIDVIYNLKKMGINVSYYIYGDGPLKIKMEELIKEKNLENSIKFMGEIPYERFNETVLKYDIFIGSGTSIIQASSIGVCSIVAIESLSTPLTYGYFSDCYQLDYNIYNENLHKISVIDLLENFYRLNTTEKTLLSKKHSISTLDFTMSSCSDNFDESIPHNQIKIKYKVNYLHYTINMINYHLRLKFHKKQLYSIKTNEGIL